MKHNLNTILKTLSDYLEKDPVTGLIPMTPMHMEIHHMKKELRQKLKDLPSLGYSLGYQKLIKEMLGDEFP